MEEGMRTNIEIDDKLLAEAMAATGLKTKRAVVEEGLRTLTRLQRQVQALEALRGIGWDGDLDQMRRDRQFAEDGSVYYDDEK
jgi:Arc/MetJ family transcription regulator